MSDMSGFSDCKTSNNVSSFSDYKTFDVAGHIPFQK